ncbi:MAG: SRPBCC family protein [Planctomycetes bacterium]|nr:SRPBCC family protein [Planctomycetota bacterium]
MTKGHIETSVNIDNTPDAVMNYVADVRNRPLFLGPLKSVSNIQGEPSAAGTRWKWTWAALGMEFEGTGECLKHERGKLYSFCTQGGIASTWTYTAQPDGKGCKLNIAVDYEVPERAVGHLPAEAVANKMKQAEAARVAENLQLILGRG